MTQVLIVFCVALLASLAAAEIPNFTVSKITDKAARLEATVFAFAPTQNQGFGILDVPKKLEGDSITKHFDPKKHDLMINGGYFDSKFEPDCYCKISGRVINGKVDEKRSGFVAIDHSGKITLLSKGPSFSKYPTVLQSGPYVIDPGGKVGIYAKSGSKARRTLIGMTSDNRLLIIITEPIYLIDLARAVKNSLPKLERLLNLDGGPSTGVMARGVSVVNRTPVRNYLFRRVGK